MGDFHCLVLVLIINYIFRENARSTRSKLIKPNLRIRKTVEGFPEAVKRYAATRREFTKTVQTATGTGTERSKAAYGVAVT